MLNNKNKSLIKDWNGTLIDKSDRLCFKEIRGKLVNIPSSMYPLEGEIEVFSIYNTDIIYDVKIEKIFNSIPYQLGKCYTNASNLYNALVENHIEGATCYEGWLLIGQNELPIHHAFVVIKKEDKNYILDFATDIKSNEADKLQKKYGMLPDDELRTVMLREIREKEKLPHSKRATCGKIDKMYLYVATKCSPDNARLNFNKLMQMYPEHPSYIGVNKKTGASKIQEMQLND